MRGSRGAGFIAVLSSAGAAHSRNEGALICESRWVCRKWCWNLTLRYRNPPIRISRTRLPLVKNKEDRAKHKSKRHVIVPCQVRAQVNTCKYCKNHERNDFLHDLELSGRKPAHVSPAIGRHL